MKLTTLYKKTSTGAIQFWTISTEMGCTTPGQEMQGIIVTEYGQLGTDSPQRTEDVISEGKNIGRVNATTAVQQSELEAQAKWEKQKKKGYVETKEGAEAGELDDLIEGGKEPMLAHSYIDVIYDMRPGRENDPPQYKLTKESKKIKFPAYVQPKLDGIRGVGTPESGGRSMWSRTRKKINSVPHVIEELTELFGALAMQDGDGELYNHDFKKDFEKIVSVVRKDKPEEGYLNVQYHMYDVIMAGDFATRIEFLANLVNTYEKVNGPLKYIKLVPTSIVNSHEELMEAFEHFRKLGYEGAMVRNASSSYVHKRSYDLQKLKEFHEDDFTIFDIEEGRGKLSGHVGSFWCRTKEGKEFTVKLEGDTDYLKQCFEDHSLWKGKLLSVVYQGYTVAERKPRFPVGKAIRDYE